jgi:hypothetical protein
MTSTDRPSLPAAWVWAALSFIAWLATYGLALPLAGVFSPDLAGLRWDLAIVHVVNGIVSLALVYWIGRGLIGPAGVRFHLGALVLPGIAIGLAAAVDLALHAWAVARFGYFDSDLIWWTAGLSSLVMLAGLALFGIGVAHGRAAVPPACAAVLLAAGILLVGWSNVPGLADGLPAESWPLAIAVGLSAVYAIVAGAIGARVLWGLRS